MGAQQITACAQLMEALVAERLDKDKQDARLTTADRTARGIAASGLDELDGKPPAPDR